MKTAEEKRATKEAKEKDRLRYLLRMHDALMDFVAGGPNYCPPMSESDRKDFGRLGSKYKFDPEFADSTAIMALPTVMRRAGGKSRGTLVHRPWGRSVAK